MSKRIIAIVAGGDSSENPVSLRSAATILEHMDKNRYEPYIVEIEGKNWQVHVKDGITAPVDRNDFSFNCQGIKKNFDYAYITIHGTPGENGVFEGYLRLMRIPFSTCDVLASALTFNKFVLNKTMKSCKVNVANSRRLRKGDKVDPDKIISKVGLPCFIKPTDGFSNCCLLRNSLMTPVFSNFLLNFFKAFSMFSPSFTGTTIIIYFNVLY